jgi:hypothetical protein
MTLPPPIPPPPMPPLPKPIPSQWNRLPLPAKIGIIFGGFFYFSAFLGSLNQPPPPPPTATTAHEDPCGWAARRPTGMTREQCERHMAIMTRLIEEEERERNPNYKPFSTTPNR